MSESICEKSKTSTNSAINHLKSHHLVKKLSFSPTENIIRINYTSSSLHVIGKEDHINLWEEHFDESYVKGLGLDGNNYIGWNHSFNGQPIPIIEMESWLNNIVTQILRLMYKKIDTGTSTMLEIGCGSGNFLRRLSPHVNSYHGTDLSGKSIEYLQSTISSNNSNKIKLSARPAHEFETDEINSYDLILINSVIQYFPSLEYLDQILDLCIEKLCKIENGIVFIGDVRNFLNVETFHNEWILKNLAENSITKNYSEFKKIVRHNIAKDFELCVHPIYFKLLENKYNVKVEILLHEGPFRNELVCYRYNVIIHKNLDLKTQLPQNEIDWTNSEILNSYLITSCSSSILVKNVPNQRQVFEMCTNNESEFNNKNTNEILKIITLNESKYVNPHQISILGKNYGYNVKLFPNLSKGNKEYFDALIYKDFDSEFYDCSNIPSSISTPSKLSTCPVTMKEKFWIYSILMEYIKKKALFPTSSFPELIIEDKEETLLSLFLDQVELSPNNICIQDQTQGFELTYTQADRITNHLATKLYNIEDEFVAILLPPSAEFLLYSVAIFKMGKAIVPLSIELKRYQIQEILLNISNLSVLISSHEILDPIIPGENLPWRIVYYIDELDMALASEFETKINTPKSTGESLAYLIHTSGTSTGIPKGVVLEHCSIYNFISYLTTYCKISSKDSCVFITNPAFDGSFVDYWEIWAGGGRVIIPPTICRYDSLELIKLLDKWNVTILNRSTALIENLLNELEIQEQNQPAAQQLLSSLRWIICGGEKFRKFPQAFLQNHPTTNILFCYGLTETSCTSTMVRLDPKLLNNNTVGSPIQNVQIYIMDQDQNLCLGSETGEIYIGGKGIARGYYKSQSLNKEKFLFHSNYGKLYKTGDFGSIDENGNLYLTGRLDSLVKIRGYRLSLHEIEEALMKHSEIIEVLILPYASNSTTLICAYYKSANKSLKYNDLIEFLKQYLPIYSIPSKFIMIEDFPLTRNGKIDKKKLLLDLESVQENLNTTPEVLAESGVKEEEDTTIENYLINLWSRVLQVSSSDLSESSNFWELGGYSLVMGKIIREINQAYNIELHVTSLIDNSTIESLGNRIREMTMS